MRRRIALLVLPALLLGACTGSVFDPYGRPGVWHPTGANEANLRTMLARPGDYRQGVSEPGSDAQGVTAAMERLRQDKVRPLPESAVVRIGGGGTP